MVTALVVVGFVFVPGGFEDGVGVEAVDPFERLGELLLAGLFAVVATVEVVLLLDRGDDVVSDTLDGGGREVAFGRILIALIVVVRTVCRVVRIVLCGRPIGLFD